MSTALRDSTFLFVTTPQLLGIAGDTPAGRRNIAREHARCFEDLRLQTLALQHQMESGQIPQSKRNRKKLDSLTTLTMEALAKARTLRLPSQNPTAPDPGRLAPEEMRRILDDRAALRQITGQPEDRTAAAARA